MLYVPIWFKPAFVPNKVVRGIYAALVSGRPYLQKVNRTCVKSIIPIQGRLQTGNRREGKECSEVISLVGDGADIGADGAEEAAPPPLARPLDLQQHPARWAELHHAAAAAAAAAAVSAFAFAFFRSWWG
ncbi:hypothetical protein BHM03_00053981 [Ensete ventricosum]|nr:hypothetical protein BHM03_00053981 [Ensete ventricosum]